MRTTAQKDQEWAQAQFERVTPETAFEFDMSPDGARYRTITGVSMTVNLGLMGELTNDQRDALARAEAK